MICKGSLLHGWPLVFLPLANSGGEAFLLSVLTGDFVPGVDGFELSTFWKAAQGTTGDCRKHLPVHS